MDTIHPPLKPFVKEINNTLLKILCELQIIKSQNQEIIELKKKEVPTKEAVSKGWFFS